MHICLLTRLTLRHGIKGGMERHAAILMQHLAGRGHRFSVITTEAAESGSDVPEFAERVWYLPGTTPRCYTPGWWRDSAQAVNKLAKEDPPDLVWSQSVAGLGYLRDLPAGLACPTARRAVRQAGSPSIPFVAIIHGTAAGELRGSWRALSAAPSAKGAAILALNGWRRLRGPLIWGAVMPRIAGLVAVSEAVAEDLRTYLHVPPSIIHVIPNGIDTRRFRPAPDARRTIRKQLRVGDSDILAIVSGRLSRQKGVDLAIRSVARVPRVHLVILGSGSYREQLERLAARLGVSGRCHFLGQVSYEKVPGYYAASDLALFPSLLEEAFPLAVIEAMASGLPVLASRVGGVSTAIQEGVEGFLIAPGHVDEFVERLDMLVSDSQRRLSMGTSARARAVRCFDTQRMVDATEAIFAKVSTHEYPAHRL